MLVLAAWASVYRNRSKVLSTEGPAAAWPFKDREHSALFRRKRVWAINIVSRMLIQQAQRMPGLHLFIHSSYIHIPGAQRMSEITGKLTLITGSTRGIGKAIAEAFVDRQARVVVHGRDHDEVKQLCESIGACSSVNGDLGTSQGCEAVLAQLQNLGPVEILVNNAGIFGVQDFFQIDDAEWLRYFQVNVMSVVRLCRALLPSMLENNWGRIINVASEAAIKPLPQMIHYSMTKTALVSVARGMAELTKGSQVTVNSVLPGPTWTAGVEAYFEELAADEGKPTKDLIDNYFEEHEPTSLIQRFIDVAEVAQSVVYLASNGAVNGSAQRVEGGIVRSI